MHVPTLCDWFILPLLLPTPTVWFSLDHKRNVRVDDVSGLGRNGNVLILLTPPAYDTDHSFRFSLGHKHSYDSAYDPASVANENQPLVVEHLDK